MPKFICTVCHVQSIKEEDIEKHIKSNKHIKSLDRCIESIRDTERIMHEHYRKREFEAVSECQQDIDEYIEAIATPIVKK